MNITFILEDTHCNWTLIEVYIQNLFSYPMWCVNIPGLLSLCSSYISYSYFLRVPVIFANLRVNISHSKPNITGSYKKVNTVLLKVECLLTSTSRKQTALYEIRMKINIYLTDGYSKIIITDCTGIKHYNGAPHLVQPKPYRH